MSAREESACLLQMRRRLEEISDEISLAVTIEHDLAGRMDRAVEDMRRIQERMEEE